MARVREFYRNNHQYQTFDFVAAQKVQWLQFNRREMTTWDALDYLNTLVDESDPDVELPQIAHLLQTAEAIRADGHPDWFVLTGFIHDLGKVLCLFGEPQWAVVGDTFPVGCKPSDRIVYPEFFALNPDSNDSRCDARDEANKAWVQKFNPYDLYSKNPNPPVLAELKAYYEDLMAKYLPATLLL